MRSDPGSRIAVRRFRAPGRVNIIGEHIDYLGGTVLPFVCDLEVVVTAEPSEQIEFVSPEGDASRHVSGLLEAFSVAGIAVTPCRGEITSTIPIGAGLSSSTALVAALAMALSGGIKPAPSVLLHAEQIATGVPGGLMDQTAILECRAGHALLLDCATGAIEHVPLPDSIGFVVIDTGTRRRLSDGRYAERRTEVEAGHPKRMRHATSEQRRVYDAVDALRSGDAPSLGKLVSASHASLAADFEVSSPALDAAVHQADAHPSCHGARLVGAGFAGCVLAIVDPGAEAEVAGLFEHAFAVSSADGASEITAKQ